MSTFEIVLMVFAAILAAASLAVVYRMIVGPTILDRALASDSLVTLVVMGMALYVAQSGATWAGPAMLGLTGLAFIGTVTFARFVAREDPRQGTLGSHPAEPVTDTSGHEAIHPDPVAAPAAGDEPDNAFGPLPEDAGRDPALDPSLHPELGADDPPEDPDHPGEPLSDEKRVAQAQARAEGAAGSRDGADGLESDGFGSEGFGADGFGSDGFGSRGFGDEGRSRWPDEPTGGTR